jgi:epoxyqueuosine reductase
LLLKDVKSAIVLIKNYKNTRARHLRDRFKIARYAVGRDYHIVVLDRLKKIESFIKKTDPGVICYCGVDTRPIAERSLAIKAGVGFLGKNTMVIKPELGSYFFIGVILTTYPFKKDSPLTWDCGQCRLCIDACPTQAITENYSLRATQCISYQTIERKSPLTEEEIRKTAGWTFGCDICQEVCPYNHEKIPLTDWVEFLPEAGVGFNLFEQILKGSSARKIPKESALHRSKNRVFPSWDRALTMLNQRHQS